MCGVAGIYAPSQHGITPGHRKMLSDMGEFLARRGPDAYQEFISGHVALGHRRLSIIDLDERAHQPMESDDWILCTNGEIYNFKDIRRNLETNGYVFKTQSDTEALLLALQHWGIDGTLQRIAGMFAFLAYNKRDNVLYVARDHLGIKPLLVKRLKDGSFCFASSAAAIAKALPDLPNRYDPAFASYFVLGAPFTRGTVFEGIERIEPAHYLKFTPDGLFTRTRYWNPVYQENFCLEDLISVVKEYEVSDVKSALFLSGGVDSSFLAVVCSNLDLFHLVSPELDYARHVANTVGRRLVRVKPELGDYVKDVENVIDFHGEPLMSCGIPHAVSKSVADAGYKMAISANGADELFLGYHRTPAPEGMPRYMPLHEQQTYRWMSEQLAHIFRDSRHFDVPALSDWVPTLHEIGNDVIRKYHLADFPASASYRWTELMTYVLHDLNPTLDAASMYNSLEVRVPFLDHRIVQGVLSWPSTKLITKTLGRKAPLKEFLMERFPSGFFQRPKLGFSIHDKNLNSIAQLGPRALRSAARSGLLRLIQDRDHGELARDEIYLGSSCFSYQMWQNVYASG